VERNKISLSLKHARFSKNNIKSIQPSQAIIFYQYETSASLEQNNKQGNILSSIRIKRSSKPIGGEISSQTVTGD
jgi:hypothetical protein